MSSSPADDKASLGAASKEILGQPAGSEYDLPKMAEFLMKQHGHSLSKLQKLVVEAVKNEEITIKEVRDFAFSSIRVADAIKAVRQAGYTVAKHT